MPKYKGLLPDTFYTVEADSEDEAQQKIWGLVKLELGPAHIIAWEESEKPQLPEQSKKTIRFNRYGQL